MDRVIKSGILGGVVVCSGLSGKDPHRQVGVGRVAKSGSLGGVMVRILAWNVARDVVLISALCTIFPITSRQWLPGPVQTTSCMVVDPRLVYVYVWSLPVCNCRH